MRERITWKVRKTASKIVAQKSIKEEDSPTYLAAFYSGSFCVDIDTLCTHTLPGNKDHFDNLNLYEGQSVKGIAGGLEIAGEQPFIVWIQSDDGQIDIDAIKISQSSFTPRLKWPLFSVQHWAETAKDNLVIKFGTKIVADEECCTLLW